MLEINLLSLVQAHKNLDSALYSEFINYYGILPKSTELDDLKSLTDQLKKYSVDSSVFDGYYVGYEIPQIGKEFDLLKFSEDVVVNIELKSENTGAKVYNQAIRNHYYLSFLKKKVHVFSYVTSERKLYTLNEEKVFVETNLKYLYEILEGLKRIEIENIDSLFNPSNYLVSPFNSTDQFIANQYFLTKQQEEIKKKCAGEIDKKGVSFVSICGKAGTGKTLLTFDIAKEIINQNKKVLVVHCGKLNSGHIKLRDEYAWEIIPAKALGGKKVAEYALVVVDEIQRIWPHQLDSLVADVKNNSGKCIFSYDGEQCLTNWETNNNISQVIAEQTSSTVYRLTEKIRTNKEIASFIIGLFDRSSVPEKRNRRNIDLKYFQNTKDAKEYLKVLDDSGWKVINYTPSRYDTHPYEEFALDGAENAHDVIGQEFDQIVAVIDQYFYYDGDSLSIKNYPKVAHYHPIKMLFQIMTRTRKKLCVVIINNKKVLSRCLSILNPKEGLAEYDSKLIKESSQGE